MRRLAGLALLTAALALPTSALAAQNGTYYSEVGYSAVKVKGSKVTIKLAGCAPAYVKFIKPKTAKLKRNKLTYSGTVSLPGPSGKPKRGKLKLRGTFAGKTLTLKVSYDNVGACDGKGTTKFTKR